MFNFFARPTAAAGPKPDPIYPIQNTLPIRVPGAQTLMPWNDPQRAAMIIRDGMGPFTLKPRATPCRGTARLIDFYSKAAPCVCHCNT
jgi:hypothetical protein